MITFIILLFKRTTTYREYAFWREVLWYEGGMEIIIMSTYLYQITH